MESRWTLWGGDEKRAVVYFSDANVCGRRTIVGVFYVDGLFMLVLCCAR